jgi:CHAD domain-containing protein
VPTLAEGLADVELVDEDIVPGASDGELTALAAKAHARLLKAHRIAALATTPDEREFLLHEVRKAAKRSRYAADAVAPVLGRPAKRYAKAAAGVQGVLGDHQDAVVERQWLRDLGVRAFLAGENGFTFGRLHGLADARAQHDEETFINVWKATQKVLSAWPG